MKDIVHRPLFWIGVALILVPTAWLAIDMYSLPRFAPSTSLNSPGHSDRTYVVFTLVMSYTPVVDVSICGNFF
jgi:hypothetical protein